MMNLPGGHHDEQRQSHHKGYNGPTDSHDDPAPSNDNADDTTSQSVNDTQQTVPQQEKIDTNQDDHPDHGDGTAIAAVRPLLNDPWSPFSEHLATSTVTVPPTSPALTEPTIHQDLPEPQPPPTPSARRKDVQSQAIAYRDPLSSSNARHEQEADEQEPSIPASSIPNYIDVAGAPSTVTSTIPPESAETAPHGIASFVPSSDTDQHQRDEEGSLDSPNLHKQAQASSSLEPKSIQKASVDNASSSWLGGWFSTFRGPTTDGVTNDDLGNSKNDRSMTIVEGETGVDGGDTSNEDSGDNSRSRAVDVNVKRLFVGGVEDMDASATSSEKFAEAGDTVDPPREPQQTTQEEEQERVVELEQLVNSMSHEKTHLEDVISQLTETLKKVSEELQTSKQQEQSWKEQYELSTRSLHDSKSRLDTFEKDIELKNAEFQKLIISASLSSHSSSGLIHSEKDESERDGEDSDSFQNAELDEGKSSDVLQEEPPSSSAYQNQIRQLQDELHQTNRQFEELQDVLLETKGQVTAISKEKSAIHSTLVKTRWKMANTLVLLNEKNAALEQRVQSLLDGKDRDDDAAETPSNSNRRLVATKRRDSGRGLGSRARGCHS